MNSKLHEAFCAPFTESEIEWRLGQSGVYQKQGTQAVWAVALAYVTARAIQNRLDSVVGPLNWKVEYPMVEERGVLCNILIRDEQGEWVGKIDGAEPTKQDAFKGGISSAFKRAAVLWGMGRYLYEIDRTFVQTSFKKTPQCTEKGRAKDGGSYVNFFWQKPSINEVLNASRV